MSWKIRHQGSPRSIEGLTQAQVIEGLQDGLWEPTDEVMADQDRQWSAIENHPQLAEIAADLEPPPPKFEDDETRLDMNPLIDVALVLLIFFILTTTYAAIQKVLEMPDPTEKNVSEKLTPSKVRQLQDLLIKVTARLNADGNPVIKIENEETDPKNLRYALSTFVRNSRKTNLLIDAQDVDWGTVVSIQDAAKGAGMEKVYFLKKKPPGAK